MQPTMTSDEEAKIQTLIYTMYNVIVTDLTALHSTVYHHSWFIFTMGNYSCVITPAGVLKTIQLFNRNKNHDYVITVMNKLMFSDVQ